MNQVIIFPRGQLTELDRARLSEADIIGIEVDDPSKVIQYIPTGNISGDMITESAIYAIAHAHTDTPARMFVNEIERRLNTTRISKT